MTHERQESPRAIPTKPVGKLQIHLQKQDTEANTLGCAKVTLSITSDQLPIYFTGTIAKEVRPGWVTLEIPPLEQWEERLRWLTRQQRERLESPEFFALLQREIPNRLRQLPPPVAQ